MSTETVGVQTGELGKLANDLRVSGQEVGERAKKVAGETIGPGDVGVHYSQQGKQIQEGLQRVVDWLASWSEASTTSADALGASIINYKNTDTETANDVKTTGDGVKA
ncbi:hypothetical protein IU438_17725 [Nocardia cyriacigeorgica]|uniref:WXG100 family type VII secretion target n=1 Tax=Nocardia cyriacigeorgica TaxID=135487 RepID=A0A4U8WHD8_9NOCA|nr:hypothetical protein [Nocardia cyriacigeorgica]MBF6087030.1 hypothetical protein [Nocardia cyriacigeorgica]MBF6093033.1 hypothetical protein [Nocardia cyriacigeorgica]MBF6099161.1 hypothetical protein [Nocardia cyriacigeorgica]MBF6397629.1 hypothetical protein [Nocardia cyriacigeorgica]MBF6402713.1 hypothetical protein [Nocardia cyriacigeorgica]